MFGWLVPANTFPFATFLYACTRYDATYSMYVQRVTERICRTSNEMISSRKFAFWFDNAFEARKRVYFDLLEDYRNIDVGTRTITLQYIVSTIIINFLLEWFYRVAYPVDSTLVLRTNWISSIEFLRGRSVSFSCCKTKRVYRSKFAYSTYSSQGECFGETFFDFAEYCRCSRTVCSKIDLRGP